ncbi:hypothetical protein M0R45_012121 [Rubus argutus]|uniref:Uncharacterized protein n=1 Tax=Rubus argutus TaxID=59490 RepID=A0AAW1YD75_RUBAR
MEPNLDLILLAFLHGSFIACVLLLVISVILTGLLFALSFGLVSIVVNDLYNISLLSSFYFESVIEPNLELGFTLVVCTILHCAVGIIVASTPFWLSLSVRFPSSK